MTALILLRGAAPQNSLPAVACLDSLAKDIKVLLRVHPVVRRHRPGLDLYQQIASRCAALAEFKDAAECLARIGERFALLEGEPPGDSG